MTVPAAAATNVRAPPIQNPVTPTCGPDTRQIRWRQAPKYTERSQVRKVLTFVAPVDFRYSMASPSSAFAPGQSRLSISCSHESMRSLLARLKLSNNYNTCRQNQAGPT